MSWMTIPLFGGQLKIKPKRQLRYAETKGDVPLVSLGFVCISFWSRKIIEREERANRLPPSNRT